MMARWRSHCIVPSYHLQTSEARRLAVPSKLWVNQVSWWGNGEVPWLCRHDAALSQNSYPPSESTTKPSQGFHHLSMSCSMAEIHELEAIRWEACEPMRVPLCHYKTKLVLMWHISTQHDDETAAISCDAVSVIEIMASHNFITHC